MLNVRIRGTEERISELEDIRIKIFQSQQQQRGNKRINQYQAPVGSIPVTKAWRKRTCRRLPKFGRSTGLLIQEAEQMPKRIITKKPTPGRTLLKLLKTKDKGKVLCVALENDTLSKEEEQVEGHRISHQELWKPKGSETQTHYILLHYNYFCQLPLPILLKV